MQTLPFAELWQQRRKDTPDEARAYWDARADEFNDITRSRDKQERRELVAYLEAKGALEAGFSVLDLGCGAGRFALEFAPRVRAVTGIDISPRMAAFARANAAEAGCGNADFIVAPWQEMDLDKAGYRGAFDLVFASMSGAVNSKSSLLAMCAASRAHCFLSGFIHRSDMLLRRVAGRLFPDRTIEPHEGGVYYAFNVLWQHGLYADVVCKDVEWVNIWELDAAIDAYLEALRDFGLGEDALRAALTDLLAEEAEEGRVRRPVRAKTAWLHWRVDAKE